MCQLSQISGVSSLLRCGEWGSGVALMLGLLVWWFRELSSVFCCCCCLSVGAGWHATFLAGYVDDHGQHTTTSGKQAIHLLLGGRNELCRRRVSPIVTAWTGVRGSSCCP